MLKKYQLIVANGNQIPWYKNITESEIEELTAEQSDNSDIVAEFDTRGGALRALSNHKNNAYFLGNSRYSNSPCINSVIYTVSEITIDEDGEEESAEPIARADWAEINLE